MHCYRLIRLSKNRKPGAFCYRVFLSLYNGNLKTKSIHLYHVREKGFLHQRGFCQGSPSSQGSASMAFYHFQFCLHPGIPSRGQLHTGIQIPPYALMARFVFHHFLSTKLCWWAPTIWDSKPYIPFQTRIQF